MNIIEKAEREGGWITSYTGKKVYPLDPRPEEICIEDIAHSLSQVCRFSGQCINFYSVGQHSIYVSHICKSQREGLLHDGSESLLCDVARPIKKFLPRYKEFEERLEKCIAEVFNLQFPYPPDVKEADLRMLNTEARDLLTGGLPADWTIHEKPYDFNIEPMTPKLVEQHFLKRYYELFN